jgi:hypothetical protein
MMFRRKDEGKRADTARTQNAHTINYDDIEQDGVVIERPFTVVVHVNQFINKENIPSQFTKNDAIFYRITLNPDADVVSAISFTNAIQQLKCADDIKQAYERYCNPAPSPTSNH